MRLRSIGLRVFVVGLLVSVAASGFARAGEFDGLADEIRGLVSAPELAKMRIGVRVVSLGPRRTRSTPDRQIVYEQNAQEPFKPASNQKLITTAAALTVLPPDFTYRTILARRGDDLVIIGSGDPSIGDPRIAKAAGESITTLFHRWADRLEADGIKTVKGGLLFDDFVFDQEHVHPSWRDQHNLEKWYSAPVGGLNFNDNCVDVVIKPAAAKGAPAVVTLIPNTPWVQLDNKSKTAAKGEPLVRRRGTGPITISVSGQVSKANDPEHPLSVAVVDPGAFFASTCRTVLAARGIKIVGESRRERVRPTRGGLPGDLNVLAVHETKVADILWRVNKSSMNLFAEALMKTMGAYAGSGRVPREGTCETGRVAIRGFLKTIGVPPDSCVLDDGSGLSHTNRTTPAVLVTILCTMDRHPLRDLWWSNLAVPGEDVGTLRRRMKSLAGSVFAKTGSIRGVSALSGYILGPGDRRYAFSVLCNDTDKAKGGSSAARSLQDAICRTLAAWEPEPASVGADAGRAE